MITTPVDAQGTTTPAVEPKKPTPISKFVNEAYKKGTRLPETLIENYMKAFALPETEKARVAKRIKRHLRKNFPKK